MMSFHMHGHNLGNRAHDCEMRFGCPIIPEGLVSDIAKSEPAYS